MDAHLISSNICASLRSWEEMLALSETTQDLGSIGETQSSRRSRCIQAFLCTNVPSEHKMLYTTIFSDMERDLSKAVKADKSRRD